MTDRQRPPRARPPSFFLEDQGHGGQAAYGGLPQDDSPPGSSSDGHSGGDPYGRSQRSKNLPTPPGAGRSHQQNASLGGTVPFDDQAAYGGVAAIPSPRSSYSDELHSGQQLHLRNVPSAREPRIEGLPAGAAHPGYAGSLQGVQGAIPPQGYPSNPNYAASDRESFFAPPAMPWMRTESSNGGHSGPPSRSESPNFFGGARTSSASPMPYYPSSSSFTHGGIYSTASTYAPKPKRTFQSNLLTGPIDKPWTKKKDRWATFAWWVTVILWFLGLAGAAVLCFFAYTDTPVLGNTCTVFTDDFSSGSVDSSLWNYEIGVGGYGTGGFEWTTNKADNVFVQNGNLYIVPTLTSDTMGISSDAILSGTSQSVDGCTGDSDSQTYFVNKKVGTAAEKRSLPEDSLFKRGMNAVVAPFAAAKRAFSTELPARSNSLGNPTGDLGRYAPAPDPYADFSLVHEHLPRADEEQDPSLRAIVYEEPVRRAAPAHAAAAKTTTKAAATSTTAAAKSTSTADGGGANGASSSSSSSSGSNGQHAACNVQSDATAQVAVNPVCSGRLVSTNSLSYGRVTIRAKMPTGDWLYPQIMLLPKTRAYGQWPLSGEIDMILGRGNSADYTKGGRDYITSGLQWGPDVGYNGFDRTRGWWQQRRTNFNQAFHTFTLEWNEKFMWIFVDKRVQRVINLSFKKEGFFKRGHFPLTIQNGTSEVLLQNPWAQSSAPNVAPFDQQFYLVMTVGAGGTNGWFPDNVGDKPWFDQSNAAMWDFANATSKWHATWPTSATDRGMVIDSVKMETTQCSS